MVVLLQSCLQDHPLVRTQHRLSHLTNLIFYARFLLKGHHSQVVKVASVSCIVFLKRPFLKIFNLMVAAKGYGLLAASVFSKSHLDECLVIVCSMGKMAVLQWPSRGECKTRGGNGCIHMSICLSLHNFLINLPHPDNNISYILFYI